jgi:Ca2+-binding RTX toxin-like protein
MAIFTFDAITASQAAAFTGADTLQFSSGAATQLSVAYLTAPEQVAVTLNGQTVNFGTGIYASSNLSFANGGVLFVGGAGADASSGSASADALFGGAANDTLNGGGGADLIQGNQGDDSEGGGAGSDTIYGGQGNDAIVLGDAGAGEANWGIGNKGDDTITASGGADVILGGQGNDLLIGGSGGDLLNGNLGDDTIRGGTGADTISGEGGRDVLSGGGGADLFTFRTGDSDVTEAGADRISDWTHLDHIQLPVLGGFMGYAPAPGGGTSDPYGYGDSGTTTYDYATALAGANAAFQSNGSVHIYAAQVGSDVVIYADTDNNHAADMSVILVGASLSSLDASNYI